ncbi:MAG: TIGR00159 family protein [Flavobacteriales bacterium]|nr:MAG: TIGR00159 family protein [Flavobacteriales bacterium TMED96]RZP10094.1 MAG: TIGR00159 family protein [Flavobacteriales bacterium]|tara:strand:+ start:2308 stop:3099 length:792 start_codon:yes stop_codon:yes gene_type:complete
MENLSFLKFNFVDALDIILVGLLLFYFYKLVKGTVAINIFLGIVIIYLIFQLTVTLEMNVLSNILGNFISVGFFALIVVFQQEIRKFLLLIGSTNYTSRKSFLKYFNFLNYEVEKEILLDTLLLSDSCFNMSKDKIGAIIVLEQSNSLEFIKSSGDEAKIEISPQIIESIFYKNGPLHDGAIIIKGNTITATRIILPVSDSTSIPKRYGLRHKAGIGITEKTDALVIVVSEQRGDVTYIKDGELERISSSKKLQEVLKNDLSS